MNEIYLQDELYYHRWITSQLQDGAQNHSIVVLTGARQVGKSTLLRQAEPFRNWRYLTLDDYALLQQAEQNPSSLWIGETELVIDEVQKAPRLLNAIKQAVDNDRNLRFVLSGSANLLLMQQVSESLAGRAIYFVLNPMTLGEMDQKPPPTLLEQLLAGKMPASSTTSIPPDPIPLMQRGFLPALLKLDTPQSWLHWWNGYVATYLERDLRQLSQISSLVDFRRVMELLALRTGQLLNQSELGRDALVSQPTTSRYINLLSATHLFERVPAFFASHTKRLVKSPRAFWTDPALAIFLSGYFGETALRQSREVGFFFESMIFLHLRVLATLMTPMARLYFWRTRSGQEVDFVFEHGRRVVAIEVKLSKSAQFRDTKGLRAFLAERPQTAMGVLLYAGAEIIQLDEKILALPWNLVTG